MAERDYTGDMPDKPPGDIVQWALQQGQMKRELLIYKMDDYFDPLTERKVRAVKLVCTACQRKVFTDKVEFTGCHTGYTSAQFGFVHPETKEHLISGGNCLCPECGSEVDIKHTSSIGRGFVAGECWPMTIGRIGDKLLLVGWQISKHVNKDGAVNFICIGYEAYVVEKKGIVRLNAFRRNFSQICYLGKWEQRKRYGDMWGQSSLFYPWDAKLLDGSTAENSKLGMLLEATKKDGAYPVSYLRLWQKKPQVENLVVQGASVLLTELIGQAWDRKDLNLKAIDLKQKSPSKMLGMNKNEFRACVRGKWTTADLEFWQKEKQRGRSLKPEELKLANGFGYWQCSRVLNCGTDWMKAARYINKQKGKDKRADANILMDYWNIAEQVGEDTTQQSIQFPPRLMSAHDRVEKMRRWKEEARKEAERKEREHLFEERFAALSVFAWETDAILIRPVRDEAELKREGDILDHCVGFYAKDHVSGAKAMFLIRRKESPESPWFTLELDEKKLSIRQNRGKRNYSPTPEVAKFAEDWIAALREARATKSRKRRAPGNNAKRTARSDEPQFSVAV